MPYELLITLPDGQTERHPLPKDVGILGRSRSCAIFVNDGSVSAKHAIVENAPDGLFILDLGSTNGVRVDGRRILRERLAPGRIFQLGRLLLEVRSAAGIDEASPFGEDLSKCPSSPLAEWHGHPAHDPSRAGRPCHPDARVSASPTRLARIRATTVAAFRNAESAHPVRAAASEMRTSVRRPPEQLAFIRGHAKERLTEKEDAKESLLRFFRRSPWWAFSLVTHVLVVLAVSFVTFAGETLPTQLTISLRFPVDEPEPLHLADEPVLSTDPIEEEAPPIESPFVEDTQADHSESANEDEFAERLGESPEFLAPTSLGGKGLDESFGTGGGMPGGAFGGRYGGKMELVARGGGGAQTQAAVMAGLKWLAKHQLAEGNWGSYMPNLPCKDASCGSFTTSSPVGVTGLALLAFLGSGFAPSSRQICDGINFGQVVSNGLQWLMRQQNETGAFGNVWISMYEQAIATMALVEASAMSTRPAYKSAAQRGVRFILDAQNPYAGWRYRQKCGDNDISVTGWCVMALKSAMLAGFDVGKTTFDWAMSFVDSVTEKTEYGKIKVGYTRQGGVVYCTPNGGNAIGLLLKLYMDDAPGTGEMNSLAEAILTDLPDMSEPAKRQGSVDYYYWYYATLGLFLYDGPDSGRSGRYWKEWNKRIVEVLTSSQHKKDEGCCYGSWDAIDRWSGSGGRVYSTALNTLSLEVYYRYPAVFTGADKKKKK